jgi:hypothetical protein
MHIESYGLLIIPSHPYWGSGPTPPTQATSFWVPKNSRGVLLTQHKCSGHEKDDFYGPTTAFYFTRHPSGGPPCPRASSCSQKGVSIPPVPFRGLQPAGSPPGTPVPLHDGSFKLAQRNGLLQGLHPPRSSIPTATSSNAAVSRSACMVAKATLCSGSLPFSHRTTRAFKTNVIRRR